MMTLSIPLLTDAERHRLEQVERINLRSYQTWNPVRTCEFVFDLDAHSLASLINDAADGLRVYELMTIRRPGDVLHYLRVRFIDVDDDVITILARRVRNHTFFEEQHELPLVEIDECFGWQTGESPPHEHDWLNDETPPHERAWLEYRDNSFWTRQLTELYELVRVVQLRLRQCDDYLLQNELHRIDAGRHHRDFLAGIFRNPRLGTERWNPDHAPDSVIRAILELIQRDDVHSVSCPFTDLALWRRMVEKQVRRAESTGLPLQRALCLCGPDSGLPNIPIEDWGGEVHIPYEGACGSDLFILPSWHRFNAEEVREDGKELRWAVHKPCHHILLRGDHGELACATRQTIGEWTLYTSTAPYEDCNPFTQDVLA